MGGSPDQGDLRLRRQWVDLGGDRNQLGLWKRLVSVPKGTWQ